ncbi:HNH endonuclease [Herbaspirillum huttiense]|uniref:HNH endonuclease n=1 Tax=Herbaspirillum huttiense TaxID=863372 RepID=UPI0031D85BE4
MKPITLSLEAVKRAFHIDPDTGLVSWAIPHGRWNRHPAGDPAGCLTSKGYRLINFHGRNIFGHQIAWAIAQGEWPTATLDHVNGRRDDNRPSNLRLATIGDNNRNQHGLSVMNKSGIRGVSWDRVRNKWTAHISINGRGKNLGRFESKDAAESAYKIARREHHPMSHEASQ